jgi:hypothetical protein
LKIDSCHIDERAIKGMIGMALTHGAKLQVDEDVGVSFSFKDVVKKNTFYLYFFLQAQHTHPRQQNLEFCFLYISLYTF